MTEVMKFYSGLGRKAPIYYWREHSGLEIDLLVEQPHQLIALEAKSGMTLSIEQLSGLKKIASIITDMPLKTVLVYGGEDEKMVNHTNILPWHDFVSKF